MTLVEFEGVGHLVSPEMNATIESWLEQAVREQAPALTGLGLGKAGPEAERYEPFERLEQETIDEIEEFDANEMAVPQTDKGVPQVDADAGTVESGTADDGPDQPTSPR